MRTRGVRILCRIRGRFSPPRLPRNSPPGDRARPSESLTPAPARGADEGKGRSRRILIDGTGAPPAGPVDIVVEGNRIVAVRSAGTPGAAAAEPRAAEARPRDRRHRHVRPARLRRPARARRRRAEEPRTPSTPTSSGWRTASRRSAACRSARTRLRSSARRRAQRATRSSRRASSTTSAGRGWDKGSVDTPEQAREWVRWAARTASTAEARRAAAGDHGGAARRGEEARPRHRPRTCSRPASRR